MLMVLFGESLPFLEFKITSFEEIIFITNKWSDYVEI